MEGAHSDNSSDEDVEIITTNKELPTNIGFGKRGIRPKSIRKETLSEIRKYNPKIKTENQETPKNEMFDVKIVGKEHISKATLEIKENETKIKNPNESSENQKLAETCKETIKIKLELNQISESKALNNSTPAFIPKTIDNVKPQPQINLVPRIIPESLKKAEVPLNPQPHIFSKPHINPESVNPESHKKPENSIQTMSPIPNYDKKNTSNIFKKELNPKTIPIPATISKNIIIKKIPAEELSKILSNILSHLIPLIDTNKFFLNQDQILEEIDKIKFSGCEAASQLLEYLQTYQCNSCQSKSLKIQLSCKHSFCESCTNSFQIVQSLENPNQSTLQCLICTKPITENEFNLLSHQNNQRILAVENEFLLEKLNTEGFLKCRICNKNKTKFFKTCCYHMCRDCVAENIREKKFQCSICTTNFTNFENILHEMVLCDNCQIKGYYIGDYMKAIEGEKCTLCSICLNKSLNQGMCQKCGKKVSKAEKLEINDFLFTKCGICKEEIFRGYASFNSCCQSKVCLECNGKDEICRKCGYRDSNS